MFAIEEINNMELLKKVGLVGATINATKIAFQ